MELQNYRRYRAPELDLRFWRTSTGLEVDFVLGDMLAAGAFAACPGRTASLG
jgi:hypothetical protein